MEIKREGFGANNAHRIDIDKTEACPECGGKLAKFLTDYDTYGYVAWIVWCLDKPPCMYEEKFLIDS